MAEKNNEFALLAIVAIVAIVGLVIMFMIKGGSVAPEYSDAIVAIDEMAIDEEENIGGEAIRRISSTTKTSSKCTYQTYCTKYENVITDICLEEGCLEWDIEIMTNQTWINSTTQINVTYNNTYCAEEGCTDWDTETNRVCVSEGRRQVCK